MTEYSFGRKPFVSDYRDWPVRKLKAMIERGEAKPIDWSVPSILDQNPNGTCVAAGILGLINCDDESHGGLRFTNADIIPFFMTIDGHGSLPEGGAECREGLKAAKAAGYILAYSRLTTQDEIDDWISNHGPVLYGTDWLQGMYNPDETGKVTVIGRYLGGHCYFGHGNEEHPRADVNSWSEDWGAGGHFWMTREDCQKLMDSYGEAWAVVEAIPPEPEPEPVIETEEGWWADFKALLRIVWWVIRDWWKK